MRAVRYWHVTLLGEHYDINHVGLCWDNDLAVSKTIDGPQAEKIKKIYFQSKFKVKTLKIFAECNINIVNYLHITQKR